jgi:hypothetical protein
MVLASWPTGMRMSGLIMKAGNDIDELCLRREE